MLTGRYKEQKMLLSLLDSQESEFVAVYGRRRVGKTFLVRETFNYKFTFQHTGLQNANKKEQLKEFQKSLKNCGMQKIPKISDWADAFFALSEFLKSQPEGKKIIFIDELPWLDTPKSKIVSAIDHFWNGWATTRKDIILIVCGSATSWIISNIVKNYGGLHNRLTQQIYLEPFTLKECEQFANDNLLGMSRRNILETYMVLGGIPYYWKFLRKEDSWAQNIDRMFFSKNGELKNEYKALYASLFKNPEPYIEIISALGRKKTGMTRQEIISTINKNQGGRLTQILEELEECDFIRSYNSIKKRKKEAIYQLIDNFTLFYYKFIDNNNINEKNYWSKIINKPIYNTWSGLAFERVCLLHTEQIKQALGISGIISNVYSWFYKPKNKFETGTQIDMLIDRDDNIINLCEIKFAKAEYEISVEYDKALQQKAEIFRTKTKTKKGVTIVMITSFGLKHNPWANDIQRQLTIDDLFL